MKLGFSLNEDITTISSLFFFSRVLEGKNNYCYPGVLLFRSPQKGFLKRKKYFKRGALTPPNHIKFLSRLELFPQKKEEKSFIKFLEFLSPHPGFYEAHKTSVWVHQKREKKMGNSCESLGSRKSNKKRGMGDGTF